MPRHAEIVDQIRATARISDPKLDTLARFTFSVMLQKAKLTDAQLQEFFNAGESNKSLYFIDKDLETLDQGAE